MLPRIFRGESDENSVAKRKRQIDTLKVFNDNVIELQEDVEYKVNFSAGGQIMAIIATLPPDFPHENPILKVFPPVTHPWVNDQGLITGAPGLLNFTVHSDLGRVVQAIIREFEKKPPPLVMLGSHQEGYNLSQQPTSTPPHSTSSPPPPPAPPSPTPPMGMLSRNNEGIPGSSRRINSIFPDLVSVPTSELQRLWENEDRLEEAVLGLPEILQLQATVDELMARNEEIARETLSKQPLLESLKQSVIEKLETVATLKETYESLSQKYQKISEMYSPPQIKEAMWQAATKSDEESERVAEEFLNGELDVEQFLDLYIEKRMLSHSRRIKEEKLSQQLLALQKASY
ncbi:vacuolar protein sorting-associated protein 37A [Ischnura elegans]|uniref:vacuolar protein sorting-associated protein 37A n=1 Tax=Ischnura elegans TaxID=197161 RepID=UPI001ED88EF0|nr:vacuolar protein sorting-associated protein 37A [Ischnura elegans]